MMKSPLIHFAETQVATLRLQLAAAERLLREIRNADLLAKDIDERDVDQWIYLPALAVRIGLSEDAIRSRVARGIFVEGIHWRRERPGQRTRQIFNVQAIQACLAGKPSRVTPGFNCTTASSGSGSSTRANAALNR